MFSLNLNIIGRKIFGGSAPLDSEYVAILDYATSQGWALPSLSNQQQQSTLLVALRTAGVWDELDVFYNFCTDVKSGEIVIKEEPVKIAKLFSGTISPEKTNAEKAIIWYTKIMLWWSNVKKYVKTYLDN